TVPAAGSIVYAAAASYPVADASAAARLPAAPASVTRAASTTPRSATTFCSAVLTLASSLATACAAVAHGDEPEPLPLLPLLPSPADLPAALARAQPLASFWGSAASFARPPASACSSADGVACAARTAARADAAVCSACRRSACAVPAGTTTLDVPA